MPYKRKNGYKKKNGYKSKGGKLKVTKALENKLVKVVQDKIQKKAELKYTNTDLNTYSTLNSSSSDVDLSNKRAIIDVTPSITNGDNFDNREGDQIHLENMMVRFRIMSVGQEFSHEPTDTPIFNPYPQIKHLDCHLIRLDKTSAITKGELDQCIRRPNENWMDTRQTSSRSSRKEFTILKSFKLPVEHYFASLSDNTASVVKNQIIWYPKVAFSQLNCKLNKKTIFNNNSNDKPVKYDYKIFITWGSYLRNSYFDLDFPTIDYWISHTFRDL